jgi:uncharacterized protein with HEPN domain
MSPVNQTERLDHIIEAITRIEAFCNQKSLGDFLSDDLLQSALLYQLMIIGEAVNNLDDQLLMNFDYPWYFPRSFRNYIAHEYFGINLTRVWNTIIKDLPELKGIIGKIRNNE